MKRKLTKYNPCWCGSGHFYVNCHMAKDKAVGAERIIVTNKQYLEKWSLNSTGFESQGCYEWMAGKLSGGADAKILDVGCGSGNGVLSLLKRFPKGRIVTVDENSNCVDQAEKLLIAHGYKVEVFRRVSYETTGERTHRLVILAGAISESNAQVVIVEGDVLTKDLELFDWFDKWSPFDLMTIWMIGANGTRLECEDLRPLVITDPVAYRLRVQNRVYDLANILLKSDGLLQVVDRGEPIANQELKDSIFQAHQEQAEPTQLYIEDVDFKIYEEVTDSKAIPMGATKDGERTKLNGSAVVSVISRKRS